MEFSSEPPSLWTNPMHGLDMMQSMSGSVASYDTYIGSEYRSYFHIIKINDSIFSSHYSSSSRIDSIFMPTQNFLGPYLAHPLFYFLVTLVLILYVRLEPEIIRNYYGGLLKKGGNGNTYFQFRRDYVYDATYQVFVCMKIFRNFIISAFIFLLWQ